MRTIRPRLVNTCVDSSLTTRSACHVVARAPTSSPTKTASTSRRSLGWSIDVRPGGIRRRERGRVTGSLVLRSGRVGGRFRLARYDFAVPAGLVSDAPQSQPIRLWPQTCDRQQRVRRNRTQLGSRSPITWAPRPAPTRLSGEIAHALALCGRGSGRSPPPGTASDEAAASQEHQNAERQHQHRQRRCERPAERPAEHGPCRRHDRIEADPGRRDPHDLRDRPRCHVDRRRRCRGRERPDTAATASLAVAAAATAPVADADRPAASSVPTAAAWTALPASIHSCMPASISRP